MGCIQRPKARCDIQCILFSYYRKKSICTMCSTLSCGSTCVKVSYLLWGLGMGGKSRDHYSKTQKEKKTNTGNMAITRTLLELELGCPTGTSGTALTPRGHQLEPNTTTAVYKSRRAGRRRSGKHPQSGDEATNCNVVIQRRGTACWPVTTSQLNCMYSSYRDFLKLHVLQITA